MADYIKILAKYIVEPFSYVHLLLMEKTLHWKNLVTVILK